MSSLTSVCISLTERILLLLGWDRKIHHHTRVYGDKEKHRNLVNTLRQRKRPKADSANHTTRDMFGEVPDLTPITVVQQNARAPVTNNFGDAFDTAVTGTV